MPRSRRLLRPLSTAVVLLVYALPLGVLVAGCGADEGIPTDARVRDFCSVSELFAAARTFDDGVDAARGMRDVGTPKGIPADARDGVETVVAVVTGAKDAEDLKERYDELGTDRRADVSALDAFVRETC